MTVYIASLLDPRIDNRRHICSCCHVNANGVSVVQNIAALCVVPMLVAAILDFERTVLKHA